MKKTVYTPYAWRWLLLTLALFVTSAGAGLRAQGTGASRAAQAWRGDSLPDYVRLAGDPGDSIQMTMPDSTFYRIAGNVIFKVNRTELNLASPLLSELRQVVFPHANRNGWVLVGIGLRGAASPEGPYWNNVRLSKGRAKALRDYMISHLDSVSLNDFAVSTVAEDYEYLLWLMRQHRDVAVPVLDRIIRECGVDNPAQIKQRLRAVDGGQLWYRLLRMYYPQARAARVVLFFEPTYPSLDLQPIALEWPTALDIPMRPYNLFVDLPGMPSLDVQLPAIAKRPHALAIGTNLLYDGFYMPNFGWAPMWNVTLEWFPRHNSHWTYLLGFTSPYYHRWSKHKFFQIRDYHIEARRYFNPGFHHTGTYLGAYVNNAKYGVGLSATKGWQGEGLGGALKVGYVLPLGRDSRWRLDLHAAAGFFTTKYDPYVWGNPVTGEVDNDYYYDWTEGSETFKRRRGRFSWAGPTEVGVSLSYDLLHYRLSKRGVSLRRKEVKR